MAGTVYDSLCWVGRRGYPERKISQGRGRESGESRKLLEFVPKRITGWMDY
jgi:hypothetical protein